MADSLEAALVALETHPAWQPLKDHLIAERDKRVTQLLTLRPDSTGADYQRLIGETLAYNYVLKAPERLAAAERRRKATPDA